MTWNKAATSAQADANASVDAGVGTGANASASTARSGFRRGRRVAAASLIAVAALSLTACQGGEDGKDGAKASKVVSSPDAADKGSSSGGASVAPGKNETGNGNEKGSRTGAGNGSGGGGEIGSTDQGGSAGSGTTAGQGKGVSGTFNGTLNYLAPGKLTVRPKSGTEQAFFVSTQTKTLGAAGICSSKGNVTADGSGYGTSPCTEAQLEKAAKMNSIEVRVTLQSGVATKIVERYHQ
ncbi:hypothetical protein FCH28_03520 [Streptomyces piniterrae]|uniref:Uncharacterized protein n=1 Tax=Streptomyces piniterrae TaxID=2571125 RepID=A0A4U0NWR5_9ACTN|nr:hypothetical protein [Streptomyces piniterrae]TJZ59179.1 hypothetical protein FCH28_03520 [Streptomyces piniterrae]